MKKLRARKHEGKKRRKMVQQLRGLEHDPLLHEVVLNRMAIDEAWKELKLERQIYRRQRKPTYIV